MELKKKDLGNAEEYLTARGWEFSEATEPTYEKLGTATFTYNKSDMSGAAQSFLTYFYNSFSDKTRISIQVNSIIKYNGYINSIKNYGCKLIKSKIEDGRIVKIYRGSTTTFKVTSTKAQNIYDEETVVWNLFIVSNEDFDLNWNDE